MVLLVIWLFVETRRAVRREMRQNGTVEHNLKSERCTYAIISFFFALSYIGRFVINEFDYCGKKIGSVYAVEMTAAAV